MSAPSKLSVEIAEAIEADIGKFGRMKPQRIQDFAALIDARLAPLVEDGARETERLDWILEHLYAAPILIDDYYLCQQMNGMGRGKTKRAAIDNARAQRPAQEGKAVS